ncbi:MFS transporter [Aeromicrobium sp.]|uniref:MFS transporter n=1 Tax=Aeromicrobium sp. TaxID=1871063 RepID=UPI002FC7513E
MTTTVAVEDQPSTSNEKLGWALVVISMAQLMVVLDSTIANIALPYIGHDLDITQNNLQWIVTGYALAFGGLLLLGGRLADLYGRRRIFMIGLVLFSFASALGGLAQNEAMLLGSRGLQGVGAALAAPAALALISTTFPAGPQRNRAFSVYAALSGVGAAIGLILGGWLTGLEISGLEGWRLTFLINVPIGLFAAFIAPRFLKESEPQRTALDIPGAVSGTLGLTSLVYGLSRAGDSRYGWGDSVTIATLVASVVLLVAFVQIERTVKNPLLPLSIFASRARATALVSMMITPAAMFAMFFFLSLLVQNVMGYSSLRTGFAFLPFTFGMIAGATISSKLIAKVDPRWLAGTGTVLAGIALYAFSRITVDDSPANLVSLATNGGFAGGEINYWTAIAPWVVLMSFGMGLTFVSMMLVAVHGIPDEDSGIGSGVLNTMQQVGGAIGLAALSTIAVHFTRERAADISASMSGGGGTPSADVQQRISDLVGQSAFTAGATQAFLVGAFMIWVASAIVWIFLNVKHHELVDEEVPEGVVV